MKTQNKTGTVNQTINNNAKSEAKALLRQYKAGLAQRYRGCDLLVKGSGECAEALQGLKQYFDQFPDIKAEAKKETQEKLCTEIEYLDYDVRAEDMENGVLEQHFETMALC